MNAYTLTANVLLFLAFFAHTFIGDEELKINQPEVDTQNYSLKIEKWVMARCGWHWISLDLLFATIALSLLNFTSYLENTKTIIYVLATYFLGYAIFWFIIILLSKQFKHNFLKLGQWVLLLIVALLLFFGAR